MEDRMDNIMDNGGANHQERDNNNGKYIYVVTFPTLYIYVI